MTSVLTIALAGDVYPVRRFPTPLSEPVDAVLQGLRAADVAIGDFEIPLTRRGEPMEKLLTIRADPEVAADLPALGFDVMTLANNHCVDYGWQGLQDTMSALEGAGVRPVGAGATLSDAVRPVVVERRSMRVGVLAFSCLLPTGMAAADNRPGIAPIHVETSYEIDPYYQMEEPGDPRVVNVRTRVRDQDRAFAEECIRRCQNEVDFLVVSIHWGFGSGELLADYQQPLGRALIDAGADVVHGHHPHAIHPIEFYHGKAILYGSGTLLGQQVFLDASPQVKELWAEMSPDSYVACLDVEPGGRYAVRVIPTSMNTERLPELATGEAFNRVQERLGRLSARHGVAVNVVDGELRVAPR